MDKNGELDPSVARFCLVYPNRDLTIADDSIQVYVKKTRVSKPGGWKTVTTKEPIPFRMRRLKKDHIQMLRDWNPSFLRMFSDYYYYHGQDSITRGDETDGFSVPIYYPQLGLLLFKYNYHGSYNLKSILQVTDIHGNRKDMIPLIKGQDFKDGIGDEKFLVKNGWIAYSKLYVKFGFERNCIVLQLVLEYHERKLRLERIRKRMAA